MKKQYLQTGLIAFAVVGLLALTFSACDTLTNPAKLTLLLTADDASLLGNAPKQDALPFNEVQSLTLTISEVLFQRVDGDGVTPVSVFNGAIDLDLVNLLGISRVPRCPCNHGTKLFASTPG